MELKYKPLVSIIIPVFNGSNYLEEAIESALNQTYPNTEILIIDDGSTDLGATRAIAMKYEGQVKYYHKANGGSSSALNFGINVMKGEWFSWLSHDDLYFPEKIEKQVIRINEIACDSDYVVYSNSCLIDSKGKIIHKWKNMRIDKMSNPEIIVNSLNRIKFNGCSFLINKTIFERYGKFDNNLRLINDFELFYRFLSSGVKFVYIDEILVMGRIHKDQVSKQIMYSKNNYEQDSYWLTIFTYLLTLNSNRNFLIKYMKYAIKGERVVDANRTLSELSSKKHSFIHLTYFFYRLAYGVRNIMKRIYFRMRFR